MKNLAIIGECMIELSGMPFGNMVQSYGGDTLNTATYIARISDPKKLKVSYVSALGIDNLSQKMIDYWNSDGVNTELVLRDQYHSPGLYLIQLDSKGERTFLYWRSQSAARYLLKHPDYPMVFSKLKDADMIYLSGISLAILPKEDRILLIKHLYELKNIGMEIVFDSNFRPKLWENIQEAKQCYDSLLKLVDIALVTFDDEVMLWNDRNIQDTITRLSSYNISNIIIKQGAIGSTIYHNKKEIFVPTIPIEKVIDTTSAGDSFNAGFLNGYLQGKSLVHCCQQGNELAGIVIQHKGAIIEKSATHYLRDKFN